MPGNGDGMVDLVLTASQEDTPACFRASPRLQDIRKVSLETKGNTGLVHLLRDSVTQGPFKDMKPQCIQSCLMCGVVARAGVLVVTTRLNGSDDHPKYSLISWSFAC